MFIWFSALHNGLGGDLWGTKITLYLLTARIRSPVPHESGKFDFVLAIKKKIQRRYVLNRPVRVQTQLAREKPNNIVSYIRKLFLIISSEF